MFPDVAKALVFLLAPLAGGDGHAGTEVPADLQDRLDFVRVGRIGGPDNGLTDFPIVDVDFFGATRDSAVAGAEAVRDLLTGSYHFVNGVLIDTASTPVGPRELPWLGMGVRRFTGTYHLETRRTA